jgi:large subunit ribosomal protein L6
MSKLLQYPINIPKDLIVNIEGTSLQLNGPFGSKIMTIPNSIKLNINNSRIYFSLNNTILKKEKKFLGTYYSNLKNTIMGYSLTHNKTLQISGVGYKFFYNEETKILQIFAGYSNLFSIKLPMNIKIVLETFNIIKIYGPDIVQVGNFCAKIKKIRSKNPYTGYGIRETSEVFIKKLGKKSK